MGRAKAVKLTVRLPMRTGYASWGATLLASSLLWSSLFLLSLATYIFDTKSLMLLGDSREGISVFLDRGRFFAVFRLFEEFRTDHPSQFNRRHDDRHARATSVNRPANAPRGHHSFPAAFRMNAPACGPSTMSSVLATR